MIQSRCGQPSSCWAAARLIHTRLSADINASMRTSRACRTSRASLDGSAARIRTGGCFRERGSWLFALMEAAEAWAAALSCGRQARMLTKMHDSVQLGILGIDEPSETCLNCSAICLVLRKACGPSTAGCLTRAVKPATTRRAGCACRSGSRWALCPIFRRSPLHASHEPVLGPLVIASCKGAVDDALMLQGGLAEPVFVPLGTCRGVVITNLRTGDRSVVPFPSCNSTACLHAVVLHAVVCTVQAPHHSSITCRWTQLATPHLAATYWDGRGQPASRAASYDAVVVNAIAGCFCCTGRRSVQRRCGKGMFESHVAGPCQPCASAALVIEHRWCLSPREQPCMQYSDLRRCSVSRATRPSLLITAHAAGPAAVRNGVIGSAL